MASSPTKDRVAMAMYAILRANNIVTTKEIADEFNVPVTRISTYFNNHELNSSDIKLSHKFAFKVISGDGHISSKYTRKAILQIVQAVKNGEKFNDTCRSMGMNPSVVHKYADAYRIKIPKACHKQKNSMYERVGHLFYDEHKSIPEIAKEMSVDSNIVSGNLYVYRKAHNIKANTELPVSKIREVIEYYNSRDITYKEACELAGISMSSFYKYSKFYNMTIPKKKVRPSHKISIAGKIEDFYQCQLIDVAIMVARGELSVDDIVKNTGAKATSIKTILSKARSENNVRITTRTINTNKGAINTDPRLSEENMLLYAEKINSGQISIHDLSHELDYSIEILRRGFKKYGIKYHTWTSFEMQIGMTVESLINGVENKTIDIKELAERTNTKIGNIRTILWQRGVNYSTSRRVRSK